MSVLRLDPDRKPPAVWQKYTYCSVQVDDAEDENLLAEFARTGKFIKEALEGGGRVLVHW